MNEEAGAVEISVIVTVREHPEPLAELYEEYSRPLREAGKRFEFVFAADSGWGALLTPLQALRARGERIELLEAGHAVGEATLQRAALARAKGDVVLVLPPYRRVHAEGFPLLVDRIAAGAELAVARRWPRLDGRLNRIQNRVLHALIHALLGVPLNDVACGVRAMRRGVFEAIPVYGDNARFIGVIGARLGFRVDEVAIPQHPRDVRMHFHAPGVYVRRLIDVIGLFFVLRFMQKPLRFFGLVGAALSFAGVLPLAWLTLAKLRGASIAGRPLLLAGVVLLVLGVQMVAIGLIGEIIVFLSAPTSYTYRLAPPPRE